MADAETPIRAPHRPAKKAAGKPVDAEKAVEAKGALGKHTGLKQAPAAKAALVKPAPAGKSMPKPSQVQPEPAVRKRKLKPVSVGVAPSRDAVAPPVKAAKPQRPHTVIQAEPPAGNAGGSEKSIDFDALSANVTRMMQEGGKAIAAFLRPMEEGRIHPDVADNVGDAIKSFGKVAEFWLSDPKRSFQAQSAIATNFIALWSNTLQRFSGENPAPVAASDPRDKRFADAQWRDNPIFDFLRQAYTLTTNWANDLVTHAEGVDPAIRDRAQFYLRQVAGAVSPSNFLATNPELLRTTLRENGENLVRGMQMLAEDIEAGRGQLKIRQSDASKFVLGVNMATTPGKVVFRNDLFELIQYAPTTPSVYKRPLLIVPPWINKFYVLDLNPDKSFIRWAASSGLTVFVISWVNPDASHAEKSFEDYMQEGIRAALDAIEQATGETDVSAIGYCVGGTLLAITLAYMAQVGDTRISSATLFTTQVDFTDPGDLKHFVDAERVASIEAAMAEAGYLEGGRMASAFNMLRPNELIWSYMVDNYMKGKEPPAFDLLVWNSDSTRMPKANHSFYLRHCYVNNTLTQGQMEIAGHIMDLSKVTIPIYNLAAKDDHIAPARSVFNGAKFFGGPMRYVMSGSGHIAGVVNPVSKPKYQFWTGAAPSGRFEDWVAKAQEHPGSWWTDWLTWVTRQAPDQVPPREPGAGKLPALADAPGDYVRVRS